MRKIIIKSLSLILLLISSLTAQDVITPNLKSALNGNGWKGRFVSADLTKKDASDAVAINNTDSGDVVWLDNFQFTNGTIEFDAKGKSGPPQSNFIGIAFRVVDLNTYDAVYFRPFNFNSTDSVRKSHSVQYISMPDWPWEKLRNNYPGKYEKAIEPAPGGDDWLHAKVVINKPEIKVYVNNAADPSLIVNELTDRKDGSVGLWCNFSGSIANLKITLQK